MKCIGFGDFEHKCQNEANKATSDSGYWCVRCEQLRRETITKQMKEILAEIS